VTVISNSRFLTDCYPFLPQLPVQEALLQAETIGMLALKAGPVGRQGLVLMTISE